VQGRFFLDVVIGESPTVLKLLSSEDEALLVRRDSFLILDLRLNVVDGITGFYLKGDGLSGH